MKKVIGYVVSIAGIIMMAAGFGIIELNILNGIEGEYLAGIGIAAVVLGVIIALKFSGEKKGKQGAEEIPIYEGVGKKRKIVGYRKD